LDEDMTANITRAEAFDRSDLVSGVTYDVHLSLTADLPTFESRTTVRFRAEAGSATWLDLIADSVESVTLNGSELSVSDVVDAHRITLSGLDEQNTVVVVAHCNYMSSGEGLHRFIDPVDNRAYLYTQFEVADCRRVFAVFEQPDIKAPLTLTVDAPAEWTVLSNRPSPQPQDLEAGRARWEFEATWPLSSYLYALIAGEYHSAHDSYDGKDGQIPLGAYCRRSLADALDADNIFTITKQGFAFFEDAFDFPYPFGKYDQIFVPEFNAGAMENPGAVTFHEDHYIFRSRVTDAAYENRAGTILHEMAHMWFGDLVTMRWWDDLWLNESFAEWAAHHAAAHATRFTDAWAQFANMRKAWAYRQDQLPSTHPIAADMVDLDTVYTNFDGITYAKGAATLKQLVAFVGEESFLTGLRHYFNDHAWGNTEFSDLLEALSATTDRDLSAWADSWLRTAGVTLLRPVTDVDDDGAYRQVTIVQEPPIAPEGLPPVMRPHQLSIGLYDVRDDELQLRERVAVHVDGEHTDVSELVGKPQADLLLVNDEDLTYAKIRLEPRSMASAIDGLATLSDPLTRSLIWASAWDMTRDAELPTAEFVALVAGAIGTESDVGLVGQVLRQTVAAVSQFADPSQRDSYCALLAESLRDSVHSAEPGSDHQLAYLRGVISFAQADDITLLRGLLTGSETIPGLTVDTDLRWTLVTRLVALGAAGSDSVDEQLQLDTTAAGQRWALTARAAAPDLDAKQQAWQSALEDASLTNAELGATIAGIMQPFQGDLVRPFISQYFASLPEIAQTRTNEMAQQITLGLYPTLVPESDTVTRTEEFLESNTEFPAGLRRLLLENKDGVLRAIRCIARDRSG
jgi:aminopeptidase N